jgi:hypothetical protein
MSDDESPLTCLGMMVGGFLTVMGGCAVIKVAGYIDWWVFRFPLSVLGCGFCLTGTVGFIYHFFALFRKQT